MRYLAVNHVDEAAIVASPDCVASLPATNCQNPYREQVARSTGVAAPQVIELTFAGSRRFSMACLYRHNLTTGATWRVQLWQDATLTTPVYDSGALTALPSKTLGELDWGVDPLGASWFSEWGYGVSTLYFAPVAGAFARVTITDSGNPDGYLQASRLFLGAYTDTTYQVSPGASLTHAESTQLVRTDGGSLRAETGPRYRELSLPLKYLSLADRQALSSLMSTRGLSEDVFVSVFPGVGGTLERDHQMQARFVRLPPLLFSQPAAIDATLTLQEQ